LVEYGRLELPCSIDEWFEQAINYPGIRIIELSPEIAVESTQLPGEFHRDPADQIIVATARINDCPLVTSDKKIRVCSKWVDGFSDLDLSRHFQARNK